MTTSNHLHLSPHFHGDDDNDEDEIIYSGCDLIIRAAGLVGNKRRRIQQQQEGSRDGIKALSCIRRSVEEIYTGMGPYYFRRAYRMKYESFWILHEHLEMGIEVARLESKEYKNRGGRDGGMYVLPPVPNGPISTSVRLACALWYFAGGSSFDIMSKYGIGHSEVMESVWYVVEAVNKLDEFKIEYPESADAQEKIAREFQAFSKANIYICAGAIDGILIWLAKPTLKHAKLSEVNQQKFLCGCKGKFEINCPAVSDVCGSILDISIAYGGSSSDCIAFERSELFERCENGLLKNGLVLFGDNAYLNTDYMATPYTNIAGNKEHVTKDDYNFFHSQLRIRVECCFEMLF